MINIMFVFLNNFIVTQVSVQTYVKVVHFGFSLLCELLVFGLSIFGAGGAELFVDDNHYFVILF
jgi:hypothetical protein